MAYLIAAFSWWAILLSKRNTEIYELKKTFLTEEISHLSSSQSLEEIEHEYNISKKMVLGEGLVFAISILLGLIFINRAFWSELQINKRLNNFLLSVTHELKTPITSIKLINQTIKNKKLDDNKQAALLSTANDEILRLESLVNNILAAAQIESAYKFNFEILDINALLLNRIQRFEKIKSGITIVKELASTALEVSGDKEALIKVIDNLLDNAIKYSTSVKKVILKSEKINNITSVSFIDFGKGIEASEKTKILTKFYRTGDEEVRETKGTGLGLFIVKQVLEAHNAKLSILDNPDGGTIFKIDFRDPNA